MDVAFGAQLVKALGECMVISEGKLLLFDQENPCF